MEPRILIVGTQPFNKMVQSRAFDSYFSKFRSENLAQIFSDARIPCKGHCENLYQITDRRLIMRRFVNIDTGIIFNKNELKDEWSADDARQKIKPKKKGALFHLLRKQIWEKKYWKTKKLDSFVDSFKPDYIFISFSKDFFIFNIAMHYAEKHKIPLILSIADDYIFSIPKSLNPLKIMYKKMYLKLMNKLMKMNVYGIFESEKIHKKYCSHFKINGSVIYIGSNITPEIRSKISIKNGFYYFGNLEFGRFQSLVEIANELSKQKIESNLHVYSADYQLYRRTKKPNNLILHNQINYDKAIRIMQSECVNIIVESFEKKHIQSVKYSLSTKVGDTLAIGQPVLAYGDKNTGAIDFLLSNECAFVADTPQKLSLEIMKITSSNLSNDYKHIFEKQYITAQTHFSTEIQALKFYELFTKERE